MTDVMRTTNKPKNLKARQLFSDELIDQSKFGSLARLRMQKAQCSSRFPSFLPTAK